MWTNRFFSRQTIEAQEFQFRQWSVRLERRAGRKTTSIILKPGEPILVRTHPRTPQSEVEKFLERKSQWIQKHCEQFEQLEDRLPLPKLSHAEKFPFLGEELSLRFVPTPLSKVFFSVHAPYLNMHIPEKNWNQWTEDDLKVHWPQLMRFYRQEAEKIFRERLSIWTHQIGLHPQNVQFKNQKTRWGSCSTKGNLNFNWRLIGAPLFVIDYIIVHEICHLKYMNHSSQFWNLVENYQPDYPGAEKWLRKNHHALEFMREHPHL